MNQTTHSELLACSSAANTNTSSVPLPDSDERLAGNRGFLAVPRRWFELVRNRSLTMEQLGIVIALAAEANFKPGSATVRGHMVNLDRGDALVSADGFGQRYHLGRGGRGRVRRALARAAALGILECQSAGNRLGTDHASEHAPGHERSRPANGVPTRVSYRKDKAIMWPGSNRPSAFAQPYGHEADHPTDLQAGQIQHDIQAEQANKHTLSAEAAEEGENPTASRVNAALREEEAAAPPEAPVQRRATRLSRQQIIATTLLARRREVLGQGVLEDAPITPARLNKLLRAILDSIGEDGTRAAWESYLADEWARTEVAPPCALRCFLSESVWRKHHAKAMAPAPKERNWRIGRVGAEEIDWEGKTEW